MKYYAIQCNSKGEIIIDEDAIVNGIRIALVDGEKLLGPKYEYDPYKLSQGSSIQYHANNVRIHFSIKPTTESEVSYL